MPGARRGWGISGVVKGVKKAFKKVTGFVKKHWKEIAIAAAVVFTAGAATGAFGAAGASGAAGGAAAGSTTAAAAAGGGTAIGAGAAAGGTALTGAAAAGTLGGTVAGTAAGAATAIGAGTAVGGSSVAGAATLGSAGTTAGAGGITTLGAVKVTGSQVAAGLTPTQKIAVAAASGAGSGSAFSKAAAESLQPGSQTQHLDADTGAPASGEGAAGAGSSNDVQLVEGGTPKQGFIKGTTTKVKDAWGGMSSFEKLMVLNTGVQMASAFAQPSTDGEFPLANQFYGRDSDGKGRGIGFDYSQSAGKYVPQDTQFIADPQPAQQPVQQPQAQPSGQQGQQQFATADQVGAPSDSGASRRFLSANRAPDDESLNRRMQFISGPMGG